MAAAEKLLDRLSRVEHGQWGLEARMKDAGARTDGPLGRRLDRHVRGILVAALTAPLP